MEILNLLFGDRADLYEEALSRASRRQQALTANLANVNTPGYRRRDVDFRVELQDASAKLRPSLAAESGMRRLSARHMAPDLSIAPGRVPSDTGFEESGEVNLETEVTALAETQLQYEAVAFMARKYFTGLKSVIREGR
ncbi:MAG: flagellar basal body rod protein FlgB [Fimbriimonadales bacterium]|nr:MAG: flagellar basal body rod protein FlgB [Fimbriimonadales bacterium]